MPTQEKRYLGPYCRHYFPPLPEFLLEIFQPGYL